MLENIKYARTLEVEDQTFLIFQFKGKSMTNYQNEASAKATVKDGSILWCDRYNILEDLLNNIKEIKPRRQYVIRTSLDGGYLANIKSLDNEICICTFLNSDKSKFPVLQLKREQILGIYETTYFLDNRF